MPSSSNDMSIPKTIPEVPGTKKAQPLLQDSFFKATLKALKDIRTSIFELARSSRRVEALLLLRTLDTGLGSDRRVYAGGGFATSTVAYKNTLDRPVAIRFMVVTASATAGAEFVVAYDSDLKRRLAAVPADTVGGITPSMLVLAGESVYLRCSNTDMQVLGTIMDPEALLPELRIGKEEGS